MCMIVVIHVCVCVFVRKKNVFKANAQAHRQLRRQREYTEVLRK